MALRARPLSHDDLPYRPSVGMMLLNRGGLVFVGKRIDQRAEGWQLPQGGIDPDEDPRRKNSEERGPVGKRT